MNQQALKDLIKTALSALQSGGEVGAKATADALKAATNPDLRAALNQDIEVAKDWTKRIEAAIAEVGGVPSQDNKIVEAHYEVSKETQKEAETETVRDLGIISSAQLSLLYWVASFGTLREYAEAAGYTQTAQAMQQSLHEAKQADEQYTAIAKSILATK
ncbi:DUF892 family protein [Hymenobacter sp. BT507]|uniref:DUF892 family protein n=1 Tax=Hymenobacter citatus TaxID=2763506 RepID=A0ABR7MKI6_9BACT|nr:DUF892 family protein [Hymenobacter citatus]MBC6611112.1 DUF892 family protein [Hymenobacter citatus]